jgi:hypothetical protein
MMNFSEHGSENVFFENDTFVFVLVLVLIILIKFEDEIVVPLVFRQPSNHIYLPLVCKTLYSIHDCFKFGLSMKM